MHIARRRSTQPRRQGPQRFTRDAVAPRRISRRSALALTAGLGLMVGTAVANAAQPVQVAFQSVTATCENTQGGDNWAQAFGGGLEQGSLRRVVMSSVPGEGFLELGRPETGARFYTSLIETGQVSWYEGTQAILPGGLETWFLPTCSVGTSLTVEWYLRPAPPATFAGQGSARTSPSKIGVRLPARARYAVDLVLSQGSVRIAGRTAVSSQTIELGERPAGDVSVDVAPASATPAIWQATLRVLPVELTGLKATPSAIRPGATMRVGYSISSDSRITVDVLDESETPLRRLVSDVPVAKGPRTTLWDGRLADGSRVADGRYTVRVTSSDYSGTIQSLDLAVVVDGRAPTATLLSRRVRPRQTIRLRLRDPGARVAVATASVSGRRARSRLTTAGVLVLSPPSGGWRIGRQRLRLTVRDGAGNTLKRQLVIKVRG